MGFPSLGLESTYRNSFKDVLKFLKIKHENNYKVYNLCCEKDRKYDISRFPNYAQYGFFDHNPPNFDIIHNFCEDVVIFLNNFLAKIFGSKF